jgi:hypothetical protein
MDEIAQVFIFDRPKDMINTPGFRVFPDAIGRVAAIPTGCALRVRSPRLTSADPDGLCSPGSKVHLVQQRLRFAREPRTETTTRLGVRS